MTLDIAGLRKAYPGFALGPVDLTVDCEVLAVLGPSGGGKSTLLQTVAGVRTPDAGRVTLNDRELGTRPPEDRGTVLLFQDGALFPHLTARENIAYPGAGPARVERLAAALEITDILDQPAPKLSGGQRQRVALARALAADPAALLLDEPLANLDAPVKRRLRDEMRGRLAAADVPVIYVTHDQREAAAIGDRVAVLAEGRIHQIGTPREVFEHPATPFVARFTGGENVLAGRIREGETSPLFDWAGHRLPVASSSLGADWTDDTAVWAAARPERLTLVPGVSDPDPTDQATRLLGQITRVVYEGDREVVNVDLAASDEVLAVSVPAGTAAGLPDEASVQVVLGGDAIHVIGSVAADDSGAGDPVA